MRSAMKWVAAGVAVAGITSLIACTLLVPYDQLQCSTAADCTARGPTFANAECVANVCTARPITMDAGATGPWACLSQPAAPADPSAEVSIQLVAFDSLHPYSLKGGMDGGDDLTLASYTPLPGVTVLACAPDDPGCVAPQPLVMTNDGGVGTLQVPGNFNGFYYLTKPDYMSEILFPATRLIASDKNIHYPVTVLSNADIMSLSSAFGINSGAGTDDGGADGGGGVALLLVTQFDCNDRHGANVSITTTPVAAGMTLYTTNGFPGKGLTATSADGEAAILGMPPGTATVTATLQGKTPQVVAKTDVIIRAGTMTWVFLRPRTHL